MLSDEPEPRPDPYLIAAVVIQLQRLRADVIAVSDVASQIERRTDDLDVQELAGGLRRLSLGVLSVIQLAQSRPTPPERKRRRSLLQRLWAAWLVFSA